MIKQDTLKEALKYDEKTGIFKWKTNRGGTAMAGDVAGSKKRVGSSSYWCVSLKNKHYYAHRLAWLYVYGEFPKGVIDHINHNSFDNRIDNLRDVTPGENSRNKKRIKRTKGILPVGIDFFQNKYRARVTYKGKCLHLGLFGSVDDAFKARKDKLSELGFHKSHYS